MSRVVEQYQRACQSLAGGVSSSTRLNRAVGHAMFFDRADGCRLWDLDGREYIDLCCSHGATLLGHGDPRVRQRSSSALTAAPPARTRTNCTPSWPSCCASHSLPRARPLHRLRHRGDHALPPPGPGLHRPREAPQVRGQLSRLSRSGDVRHRHARRPAWPRGQADPVSRLDRHAGGPGRAT